MAQLTDCSGAPESSVSPVLVCERVSVLHKVQYIFCMKLMERERNGEVLVEGKRGKKDCITEEKRKV